MNFSKTLRALREAKNLTQGQVASYLNLSRPTITAYETKSRQPDYETLEKLADYFEVSIDYLITGENPVTLPTPLRLHGNGISFDLELKSIYQQLSVSSKYELLKYAKLLRLHETHIQHSKK